MSIIALTTSLNTMDKYVLQSTTAMRPNFLGGRCKLGAYLSSHNQQKYCPR
jgi:hypothetical protein